MIAMLVAAEENVRCAAIPSGAIGLFRLTIPTESIFKENPEEIHKVVQNWSHQIAGCPKWRHQHDCFRFILVRSRFRKAPVATGGDLAPEKLARKINRFTLKFHFSAPTSNTLRLVW